MIDFINPKLIALAQVAMAIGIIRFWFIWFRTDHNEPWLPAGYLEHERAFVYPDSVMSVLMMIAAILIFLDKPLGEKLTLVCGGMMLFLSVIDIAYFAQHGLFAKEKGGAENWGLVIPMVAMSFLMIARFI